MSTDSEQRRPSFRFRDKFSRLKDKVKDKIRDKSIKHNVTLFVHENLTSNDTSESSRHGFRQNMHHFKDVLKNKTHYESFKEKIKDKMDIHDNKTYPKGFYDSLFSPETENDYYLQTALVCLWVIAVLCIIPTIVVIFLPARKKTGATTSTHMIFFHIFFCELCYLTYVLLAMINVAKDFRLGSVLCDVANYGMYVTIPIMQFALLFLSLERLSKRFELSLTWVKIFTKPYLIQVILCGIWIFLIALLITFMFIKKQFNFNFVRDQIENIAPPIFGDVVNKIVSRRHHCSIDGRLSSLLKTLIIILFIILIVKPILISLSFNFLTPYCCKNKRRDEKEYGDRRITKLVTIFLLLNFFFSFPFYLTSMFKSIFTNIDSTKDTFTIILKICFILRITNIIFECLAFYIFERNSWSLLSKLFYYGTCKKFPIFNKTLDDDVMYTRKPSTQAIIDETARSDDDDEEEKVKIRPKKKRSSRKKSKPTAEIEPDEDDDGSFVKKPRKQSKTEKVETPVESDDESPVNKRKIRPSKKTVESDKVETKKRKSQIKQEESDEDEDEAQQITTTKRKSQIKQEENDEDEDEDEAQQITTTKRKSQIKQQENDEDEDEAQQTTTTKRKSEIKRQESDNDEEDEEEEPEVIMTTTERKSRKKKPVSDDEEREITTTTKRKSRPKVKEEEKEEEQEFIEKPKPKSKSRHKDVEIQIPNGPHTSRRRSSPTNTPKTTKSTQRHSVSDQTIKRRSTPPPAESETDTASSVSRTSSKIIKPSTKTRPSSSSERKGSRTASPNNQRSQHRTKQSPSSRPRVKQTHHTTKKHEHGTTKKTHGPTKKSKKDRRTKILEMSDDV